MLDMLAKFTRSPALAYCSYCQLVLLFKKNLYAENRLSYPQIRPPSRSKASRPCESRIDHKRLHDCNCLQHLRDLERSADALSIFIVLFQWWKSAELVLQSRDVWHVLVRVGWKAIQEGWLLETEKDKDSICISN